MSRSPSGRRPGVPLKAAEAAFRKATTKPIAEPPKAPSIPGVKETVTLRIDQDVLEFFQEDGPGWQERINASLCKAAGK
ncbi:BrnA antitoxin family protein [Microvirga sesbaniae]|uniref:BrnA antitoxin family protein n=1 Tax=Microvirga sesbaniae TaxID=681392 RepID=UPI0021C82C20|nr:BrnA antitoxin family protein [Microvirga sp. HBU67692]